MVSATVSVGFTEIATADGEVKIADLLEIRPRARANTNIIMQKTRMLRKRINYTVRFVLVLAFCFSNVIDTGCGIRICTSDADCSIGEGCTCIPYPGSRTGRCTNFNLLNGAQWQCKPCTQASDCDDLGCHPYFKLCRRCWLEVLSESYRQCSTSGLRICKNDAECGNGCTCIPDKQCMDVAQYKKRTQHCGSCPSDSTCGATSCVSKNESILDRSICAECAIIPNTESLTVCSIMGNGSNNHSAGAESGNVSSTIDPTVNEQRPKMPIIWIWLGPVIGGIAIVIAALVVLCIARKRTSRNPMNDDRNYEMAFH